jgi:hypothetical protein
MRAAMASNIAASVLVKKSKAADPIIENEIAFQEQELDEYFIEE